MENSGSINKTQRSGDNLRNSYKYKSVPSNPSTSQKENTKMVLKYGYAIGEQVGNMTMTAGRLVTPARMPDVISLSVVNSSTFLVFGTKPEILEWLRTYSHVRLEVTLFDDRSEAPHVSIPDVVVDLLPALDSSGNPRRRSLINYLIPTYHPDPSSEEVHLEFRPVNHKIDENIEPYFRIIVERGSTFGEIVDEISTKWDSVTYPSLWDNFKNIASFTPPSSSSPSSPTSPTQSHHNSLSTVVVDQK
ncbi:10956_t:CDS:2 [Acaulospora colombiana]|uniref:10956_t:CDS:1 n=1 Tax=Acaulospora colombiana TaxID=27376 RepID=A0ACA9KXW8_9GLOM|nr:10956_t:CDS:2 [Acaulospora colombiana]